MDEELFPELRTLRDVWDYVWSGYAVTTDTRRRVTLGMRPEPRLPLAIAEPGALMTHAVCLAGAAGMTLQQLRELFDLLEPRRYERGLVQLRAGGTWWRRPSCDPTELATSGRRWCSAVDEPQVGEEHR
jgi:hypothetical protein